MFLSDSMTTITFVSEKEASTVRMAIEWIMRAYINTYRNQGTEEVPFKQEADILREFGDYLYVVVSKKHIDESIAEEYKKALDHLKLEKRSLDQAYDEDAPIDD